MNIVFLHALPFDGRMWDSTAAALDYPSIAPSLWSLGESIEEWASAVVELAGTDELIVVGCSVGGSCALEVARAAPDQVAGIVLVGAKPGVNPDPALRDQAIKLLESSGMAAAWDTYWEPLFADATSDEVKQLARSWAMDQDVASVVNGVRAFHDRRDLTEFAHAWRRPLVGISGDRDNSPPPAKLRAITRGANRSFHLVDDCGHYVNLEQPERFETILTSAIQSIAERA